MSFFAFAPSDGFVSKSFEGLKYRQVPAGLLEFLQSAPVADVRWVAIGPDDESWCLSYVDSDRSHHVVHGASTPSSLKRYVSKAKRQIFGPRDQHVRIVFGPQSGFFAWDRGSFRWSNLPTSLEETVQSWLSPAGWKYGPPRSMAMGADGAWFALSEYGEVEYRLPKTWPTLADTVDEWEEEGFDWSELAFIALDPCKVDQFIAIRTDGVWAGSCDENNAHELEAFASAFFSRPASKQRPEPSYLHCKPRPQANGASPTSVCSKSDTAPTSADQAPYEKWSGNVATAFAAAWAARGGPPRKLQIRNDHTKSSPSPLPAAEVSSPPSLLSSFPYIPSQLTTCSRPDCLPSKSQPDGLRACKHDVERLFRGSGMYGHAFLKQERLKWHPDRFGRLCEEGFLEKGRRLAEEMWKIIDELMGVEEKLGQRP